jgi:hypothetical protein
MVANGSKNNNKSGDFMSNELVLFEKENLDKLYKACDTLSKSKMVPVSLQGKPADIFAILVMGTELGIKPMQALNSINVIQGKPTVSPQLMIAMIKGKIPNAIIKVEKSGEDILCTTARSKEDYELGLLYTSTWNMERAKKMNLVSKDNYIKQPETMLRWRAVAESCRQTFPDVLMGMYATDEFIDFNGKIINQDIVSKSESKNMMDEDFPIPPEEKEVGDLYRIQNGKFRSKQLKDLSTEEIADYREELIKRKSRKEWETDLISVFSQYLGSLEGEPIVVD